MDRNLDYCKQTYGVLLPSDLFDIEFFFFLHIQNTKVIASKDTPADTDKLIMSVVPFFPPDVNSLSIQKSVKMTIRSRKETPFFFFFERKITYFYQ